MNNSCKTILIFGLLILLAGASAGLGSRTGNTKAYATSIQSVQLYSDQALVQRIGKVALNPGRNQLIVRKLPHKIIDDAVRVRLPEGSPARIKEIRVESIHQENFDSQKARNAESMLRGSEQRLRVLTDRYQSLKEEENFLSNLRVGLPDQNKDQPQKLPVHVTAWQNTLNFTSDALARNHKNQILLQEQIDLAREELNVALVVAERHRSTRSYIQKEVHIILESKKAHTANLALEYRVRGAAWYPVYAARVLTESSAAGVRSSDAALNQADVKLQTYALVRNETGEDWPEARLSFSAADPQGSVTVPRLASWRIRPVLREVEDSKSSYNDSPGSGESAKQDVQSIVSANEVAADEPAPSVEKKKAEEARKPSPSKSVKRGLRRKDVVQQRSLQSNISRSNTYYQKNQKLVTMGRAQTRAKRSEELMRDYKSNYMAQEKALKKGNYQESLNRSEALLENIRNVPARYRDHFEVERKRAMQVKAQSLRMLENQKLIRKLISPRRSAGGFDYRYRAPLRETIQSDASFHKIYLGEKKLRASLNYETSPENALHAFLIGRVRYTEDTPLLAGPVSVFHNSDYMGEANLENINAGRPFELFLGSDENIRVSRVKHRFRETGGFLSKRYTYQNETEIKIHNLNRRPIKINIFERLPYSSDERIEITDISTSPGKSESREKVGLYRFELEIPAGKERKIKLRYKLSHDANVLPNFYQTGGPAW